MEIINEETGARFEIAEGEHTVGRGPWLQIADKRVSRDHAVLRAGKGTLALCPKHRNPCYYKPVGGAKLTVLPKEAWQSLAPGDLFALLPNDLIFKVEMKDAKSDAHIRDDTEMKDGANATDDALFGPLNDKAQAQHGQSREKASVNAPHAENDKGTQEPSVSYEHQMSLLVEQKDAFGKQKDSSVEKKASHEEQASSALSEGTSVDEPNGISGQATKFSGDLSAQKVGRNTKKPRSLPSWLATVNPGVLPAKKRKDAGTVAKKAPVERERSSVGPVVSKDPPSDGPTAKNPPSDGLTPKSLLSDVQTGSSSVPVKSNKSTLSEESKLASEVPKEPSSNLSQKAPSKPLAGTASNLADDTSSKSPAGMSSKVSKTTTSSKSSDAMSKDGASDLPPCPYGSKDTRSEGASDLPPCPYGSRCYRKNPAHFTEYSHPSTTVKDKKDVGTADRPECPYGSSCYRKNPAHRAEYSHSAPSKTRPKRQPTRHGAKNSVVAGDSDDDGESNTYDYNDSFIDDKELSDASTTYSGDSEDMDWAPDDSEDITELLSDAKSYVANKKL